MKKPIHFLSILCGLIFFSSTSFAQSTLSFGGIYSTPMGEFGRSDIREGGFAQPGFGFQFEAQMQVPALIDEIRIGIYYSYQNNPIDIDALNNGFNEALQGNATAYLQGGGFRPVRVMIGPSYRAELSESFSATFKTGIGMLVANMNPINIQAYDSNNDLIFSDALYFQSDVSFSYLVGFDVDYKLSNYWSVGLFADFSSAKETLYAAFDPGNSINGEQYVAFLNSGIHLRMNM
ncbi:hypothetical protein [Phaeocystidibacter luteus]|uniref:Outer membrane beta-barrel protein n=1 Tax=Phaeocystidibacter luteus TaxID=911197 RepID=A0A6N6RGE2_9FLAO|nr:hypothetical protein [Phaeocystidibacter luteus]KAB2810158.1 hypothetical protein F8C67_07955 [Phaeocystidibacter luteus]